MNKKITVLVISHLLCVVLGYGIGVTITKPHGQDTSNIDATDAIISESISLAYPT